MMVCPICNAQVEDNAAFCTSCGAKFVQPENYSAETTVLTADMLNAQPAQQPAAAPNFNYQQPQQPQQQFNNASYQYGQQPPQAPQQNPPYGYQQPVGPVRQLKTNRSFIKTVLLSMITLGIYGLVVYGQITDEVNLVCSRYDGRKSMNYYLLVFLVTPLTCGIAAIVWMHNLCDRIGNELARRRVDYSFGAKDFWLWCFLGSFIFVGPFVFIHKFFKASNKMNEHYNMFG